MNKKIKNIRINIFTFIEIVLAVMISTITIALDLGYLNQLRTNSDFNDYQSMAILNAFSILALLVTAIGIMGIQLIHVNRRTIEIGLRKAVGASDKDILFLIIKDTFRLILAPAVVGVLIGVILSAVIPFDFGLQARTDFVLIIGCILAIILLAGFSGLLPAMKAAHIKPIDILRNQIELKRKTGNKIYEIVAVALTVMVIVGGIVINYRLEADYKEDIINSAGAPPASTQEVPDFMFKDTEGNIITSASLKGRRYCLMIWDIGCPASAVALDDLNKLVIEGIVKDSDIYAVSIDKSFADVKEYIASKNVSIAPLIDYKKSTKWAFNVGMVPALYLVDEEGVISARVLGWSGNMKEYFLNNFANKNENGITITEN